MVESKKKTTAKKSSTGSKKTTAKSTQNGTKKSTKKTVSAAPLVAVKDSSLATRKSAVKTKKYSSHFKKELLPSENFVSKNKKTDTSLFTTILAIFVVVLVVLWGYIYSRQSRMMEPPAPPVWSVTSEPQRISISSSVTLTPEVIAALEYIVTQITIGPDEVLQNVRIISDVTDAKSESDFFADVQSGDMVFQFKSASLLYRPSVKQIIKTGILPPPKMNE